jgi:hypothetical protein
MFTVLADREFMYAGGSDRNIATHDTTRTLKPQDDIFMPLVH